MQKWRIGDVTITKIVELEATGGTKFILPQATREAAIQIKWMYPHFMDEAGRLRMSIHALVIEAPGRRIVVDTCVGNDKPREIPGWSNRQGPFLRELAAAGFGRETIDTVVCTHLHVDHVGWNTMLVDNRWVPTFLNARYLLGRAEFEYWRTQEMNKQARVVYADSVQPVFDAGLVELVETTHRLCDEVTLTPTVGHTPGHVSVHISSRGIEALITGDFVHHPCQLAKPEWASSSDYDATCAAKTRRDMLGQLANKPTLLIGTHFAGPTAGRVARDGDAFRLEV